MRRDVRTKRAGRLALAAIAVLVAGAGLTSAPAGAVDLEKVHRSVEELAGRPVRDASSDAALAIECLALAAHGAGTESALVARAEALIDAAHAREGEPGWGLSADQGDAQCGPGSWDAFSDGTCNPAGTVYQFQTGLVASCLARASLVTGEPRYSSFAADALDRLADAGIRPEGCEDCFFYWYSDQAHDEDRYVRNTNALMGMANAWTYRATGEARFAERARAVGRAELREHEAGNNDYLGIDDPDWSAETMHIENHAPYVAKGLLDIARTFVWPELEAAAVSEMNDWLDCGRASCVDKTANITVAPCFLRRADARNAGACARALAAQDTLSPYQLWTVLD